jgi:hypothetical protein
MQFISELIFAANETVEIVPWLCDCPVYIWKKLSLHLLNSTHLQEWNAFWVLLYLWNENYFIENFTDFVTNVPWEIYEDLNI